MELSGCDAVFVLPGADLDSASRMRSPSALRLNGSATCMAPRRVFGHPGQLLDQLCCRSCYLLLDSMAPANLYSLRADIRASCSNDVIEDAVRQRSGAVIARDGREMSGWDNATDYRQRRHGPEDENDAYRCFRSAAWRSAICLRLIAGCLASSRAVCPYALTAAVSSVQKRKPSGAGGAKSFVRAPC